MQRRSFNFKNCILFSNSCGSSACLPLFCVERDSSREVVVDMNDGKHANAMPAVTQSACTKPPLDPPSPPPQLPFSLRAAFVLSSLICVGIYHGKGDTKNLALVWKKSHLQSFTLTKTAFYHYNNLRQWHISAWFISSNKQTNGDTRAPILWCKMCRARRPSSPCVPCIR